MIGDSMIFFSFENEDDNSFRIRYLEDNSFFFEKLINGSEN